MARSCPDLSWSLGRCSGNRRYPRGVWKRRGHRHVQAREEAWRKRGLEDLEPVYVWVDGVPVAGGAEAVLVVIVGCVDGRKVVVSVEPGARESVETWPGPTGPAGWGLRAPRLVVADGHLGVEGAVRNC